MNATVKLSAASLKLTTDIVKGDMQIGNKWVKLSDSYRAEGVTSAMLETSKKGGDEDLREQVKAAIIAAFTESQRKLLTAETKTLSESGKGAKKTPRKRWIRRSSFMRAGSRQFSNLDPCIQRELLGVTLQIDDHAPAYDAKISSLHPYFNPPSA